MTIEFQLKSVKPYQANGQFGQTFTLGITLQERDGARLNWLECTNRPYMAGMAQNTWTDMFKLVGGQSSVFDGWNDTDADSGKVTVDFVDPPSIRMEPGAQRTLQFWIVVLDGVGLEWAVWRGLQTLACDAAGAITTMSLVRIQSISGNNGEPPYPPGFLPY